VKEQKRRIALGVVLALSVVAALPLFAACGGDDSSANDPNVSVVQISDNQFTPAAVVVRQGASVKWVWSGKHAHSVVGKFGDREVSSAQNKGSGSLEFTMNAKGAFPYQCGVHGAAMTGKITVE
jgi:plastocyanin